MIPIGGLLTILTAKPKGKCIHFSHYFSFQLTTSFAFPLPKKLSFEEINEKENVNFDRGVVNSEEEPEQFIIKSNRLIQYVILPGCDS